MQIIDQIERHPSPPISMDKKQVESLTEIVIFLQAFLEGYKSPYADGDEADPLEMRIADAVHAAEDVIKSHIVDQIRPAVFVYEGLAKVMEHLDLIKKEVTEIVAVKGKLKRRVSASLTCSYERMMKLIEHMDWIKKEALKIVAVKYQADSSTSADLYDRLLGEIPTLKFVELILCTKSAVKSAKRMVEEQEESQGEEQVSFKVSVTLWEYNEELHIAWQIPIFKLLAGDS